MTPVNRGTEPHSFAYEACDIPAGMTIREYRRQRAGAERRRTSPQRARQVLRKILRILDPAGQPDQVRRDRRG
jgi:hypothetical protein